jgi:UDP-2,3-diacylglucosamine hydrolase
VDEWIFSQELNIPVFLTTRNMTSTGKKFLLVHGDGLGPGDKGYKFLKKSLSKPDLPISFSASSTPAIGMAIANYSSRGSRSVTCSDDDHFLGEENEWLITYCKSSCKKSSFHYFIFRTPDICPLIFP